jgi:hypothetical protein
MRTITGFFGHSHLTVDWKVDSLSGGGPFATVQDAVYPNQAINYDPTAPVGANIDAWPNNSTSLDVTTLSPLHNYLAMEDYPGFGTYGFNWALEHGKVELETYVIALDGPEGLQFDDEVHGAVTQVHQHTLKSYTVYGGVKWYNEWQAQPDSSYLPTRHITDTTGNPSSNLTKALHKFFDYYFVVPKN